jgi:hypothetical protein
MRRFAGWIVITALAADAAQGQGLREVPRSRAFAGGAIVVAQPTGEFADYVNIGFGAAGHLVWVPDADGALGLRIDGNLLVYGSETRRYQLVPLVNVDVTTNNMITSLLIGPQLLQSRGTLGPYAFGQIGFSYFGTESSVEGSGNVTPFASTTNYDDFTFASSLGGGVLIRVSSGRRPVAIDLGMRYVYNGRVRYLREGSITISGNTVLYTPIESETNLLLYHVGVSVGLGRRGRGW